MRKMRNFLSSINSMSQWSGKVIGYLILPLVAVVVYTALMRYAFNKPPIWGFEVTLFIYGLHFVLAGAYCLNVKAHVAVDVLPRHLSLRGQNVIEIVASLVILFVCGMLVWLGSKWAWEATKILEHSIHQTAFNPPVWWYKWAVPVSAGLIALQALANLVGAIQNLLGAKSKGKIT